MESQHRAVLSTVAELIDAESIARRDRTELIRACRTLADWLRQYVEIAAEQSEEIQRLQREHQALEDREENPPGPHASAPG